MKTFTFYSRYIISLCLLLCVSSSIFAQRHFATNQRTGATGLLCAGCVVTDSLKAADANLQTHSTLNVPLSVLAATFQELIFPAQVAANTPLTIKLGTGDNLLDVTALGGVIITPYNGNVAGTPVTAPTLASVASSNNQLELIFSPTTAYDRVRVTLSGGLLGALSTIYLYDAFYTTPGPPICNTAYDELHGISSALLGLGLNIGGVANPLNAIDGNINTASTLNAGVGALGAFAQQTIIFQSASTVGDSVRLTLSLPKALLDVGLLTNITISSFNGNTNNNDNQQLSGSLLRLRLLDLTNNRQRIVVTYAPSKVFDRVQLRLGGIASVLSTLDLYEAEVIIPKPIIKINNVAVTDAQICSGGTIALTATSNVSGTTFSWYTDKTGGTPVATTATFTTLPLTANATYYVSATRPGCATASDRAAVTVNVNQVPAAPVVVKPDISICPGSPAVFAVTPIANVTINWYTAATGGTLAFTGNTFNTGALTATTSYYAEAVVGGTCVSATRTKVTATVSVAPAVPTLTIPNPAICDGDVAVLAIASPVAGQTYNWYDAATGGTLLYTGTNFTSPVLHANTSYYAEAVNLTGCASGSRVQANVTVASKPADPALGVNSTTVAAGQTATINVTNAQTGITYKWYTSVGAATPVFTGNSFVTPQLFSTTTYYVAAVNATGCESANRTAITLNVGVNNSSAPCTFANTPSQGTAGGLCLLCSVESPELATDADTTTASTIHVGVGVGTSAFETLQFQQPGFAGDKIRLVLQTPTSLIDVNVLGTIMIDVYNGTTLVNSYPLNSGLLTLRLLSGTDRYSVTVPATGNYDRVRVSLKSVLSAASSLQIYYAVQEYPAPVFDKPAPEICKGGNATINITAPNPANGTYKWYTTPTGGTALTATNNGATFTTPALNANTTYYVEYSRNGSCASPVRVPVPVTVNDTPVKPVVTPPSSIILAGETATFKATVVNGATIKWYTQPTGGTPVFTGSTFTTPALSTNTTYYAEASLGTCVSPDRTVVPVTVNSVVIPDITVTPSTQSVNAGTTGTITASSTTPGTIFNWYTTPTGGTPIFTGETFVTPPVFANGTYYAEAVVTATGAKSATRAPAVVNVINAGSAPVACDAATTQTSSVTGLLCVLCGTANEARAVDNDRNSFSQIHVPVGLLGGSAQQLLHFTNAGIVGDSVVVELGIPGSLVDVGVLSQINITTYTGSTNNNDRFQVDGSLLHLTLLNGTNRFRVAFKATHAFDGVEIQFNSGLAGVFNAVNVYDAYQSVAAPVLANPSGISICQGTSGTLTAAPVPANVTIKWYTTPTGGTALTAPGNGATFTTPVLNVTTTYYAEASRTTGGCAQPVRTPVTVTVTPALAPPSVHQPAPVCSGQPVIFTADAVSGVSFNWYAGPTGGSPLATNQLQFTTPPLTVNTSYYVEAVSASCGTSARIKVDATVTSPPAVPITPASPVQICSGSQAVVSVSTVVPGITYTWYAAPTGGTPLATGSSYTTPALTANTPYYVEAVSTGGCTSSARAKADVSVNPTPVAPTVSVNPAGGQITSGQTATLTASSSTSGVTTYKWYLAPTGGTAVLTGATVTTPALTSTTTYYVEAITGSGCISDARTAVTITVNPIFSTSCDFASTQKFDIIGGLLCVGCAVNSPDNAVDSDTTTFSQLDVPINLVGGSVSQQLIFLNSAGVVGDTVRVKIAIPETLLSASVLGQLQIASYNGSTFNNDATTLSSSLLTLSILADKKTAIIKFAPKGAFDRVEVKLKGALASLFNFVNIYYATKQVELPAVDAKSKNICAGNTATFTVTNPRAGVSYNWYTAATGGTALKTGTSFTTPVLNATTTYYVESSRTATGCANPNRVAVTVNVTAAPVNAVVAPSAPVCSGSGATFNVTPVQNGVVYTWYATATGGAPLGTGSQFTTQPLTANTPFWVEASANGCVSPARTEADAIVNPIPVAPTFTVSPAGGIITAGGTATITAGSITNNAIIKWYSTLTGGSAIATGTPFTTPPLSTTTTYYIESSLASGCVSTQRTPVTITVTQPVVIPDVDVNPKTQTIDASTTGSLTATSTTPGAVFNWFTTPTGGTSIFTGANFTTPTLFANTTYYAESSIPATGEKSTTRAAGVVNVTPNGTSPLPCDAAISQTNSTGGVLCVACGTTNGDAAVDNNGNSFSQIHIVAGLAASSEQTLRFANTGIAGDSVTVDLGYPGSLADLGLLSQIQIGTLNGTTDNGDKFTVNSSLLTIKLLNGTSRFRVTFAATKAFDRVQITFNSGLLTALSAVNVYDAYQSVAKPIVPNATGNTICQGTSGTLTASPVPANVTIKWYTAAVGGTQVGTGATISTPILNTTTTYYAEASRTASGCAQAIRTPATVTVSPAPAVPVVTAPNQSVCSGFSATFIAQAVANVTFNWYATATGGTPIATNTATFTTAKLTTTTDYYVEAVSTAGSLTCGSSARTPVKATVTQTPSVPVLATAPPICSGSFAVLSVSPLQQGVTYNWYTTATGGTAVATNTANYTTPNLTTNTTYYVEAVATSATSTCTSTSRGTVTVIVNSLPGVPTISVNPVGGQITSGQTATLTATSTAGTTINWYTSATGGSPIATTASFTTPALTSNTTYYAEAVSSTTGCISSTRAPFTVKVSPIFVTSCDFASTQLPDVNNGILCAGCGVDNGDNAVDQDITNFSTLHLTLSVGGGYVAQRLIFSDAGTVGDTVSVKISIPASLASADVLSQLQIASFNGNTFNNDRIDLRSALLKLDILTGGQTAIVKFAPKTTFTAVEIRLTAGLASIFNNLNIYYASKQVEAPTLASNTSNICAGAKATFTVNNARAGVTYKWYTAAVGGTPVFTGANFEKDGIMATTTYFVESSRTSTGCANPNRVAATVNVTPLPPNPIVGPYAAICAGQPITLTVTNANGAIINWYTTQTGGTPVLANSATYSPSLQSNIIYYVEAVSAAGGCSSPARTAVPVTVNKLPSQPFVSSPNVSVCFGSSAPLAVEKPEVGVDYNWYTTPTGGTSVHNGANFPTPAITAVITYYVEATNSTSGCVNIGGRTSVQVTPNAVPVAPMLSADASPVCNGGGTTIRVTNVVPGATYNWYILANGTSPVHTGTTYAVSNLVTDTIYYVEAVNLNGTTNCTSATRTPITINVLGIPTPPVVVTPPGGYQVCSGSGTTLNINPLPGLTYNWYDAATGGSLVHTGSSFPTGPLTVKVTYWVEASNGNGCTSSGRTAVPVEVNNIPANPVLASNPAVCLGSPATITVTTVPGITYNWYDAATGGKLVFTGNPYVTDPITATTDFYVEAVNGTSCSSGSRTLAEVTINPAPAAPVTVEGTTAATCAGTPITLHIANPQGGFTYKWYTTVTGGTPLSTTGNGETFTTPVLTANATYYVEAINSGGCASSSRTAVPVEVNQLPSTPVPVAQGGSSTPTACLGSLVTLTATATPATGITFKWYTDATGGSPVFVGIPFITPAVTGTITYYVEAVVNATGCASGTRAPITITIDNTKAPDPAVDAAGLITCQNSNTTLNITNPVSGTVYSWYTAPAGGSAITTGQSFITPALTANTTYYVEATSPLSCNPSTRVPVNVTVTTQPATPTFTVQSPVQVCRGSSAQIAVASPQPGLTYNWYTSISKTTLVNTGETFTTGPVNANATYYVEAVSGSCSSATLASIQVVAVDAPDAPVLVNGNSINDCQGGQATLTIANPQPGFTYNWYSSASGGTPAGTGISFTTPALSVSTIYFAEAVNVTGCPSAARTSVTVTVTTAPITPQASTDGTTICPGTSTTVSATSGTPGAVIKWYADATGGAVLATGTSFTTPTLTATTIYYAEAEVTGGCVSTTRTPVTVTVLGPLTAPVVTVDATTASSVTFAWQAVTGASGYQVSIDNGQHFITPSSGATGLTHTVTNLQPAQAVTIIVRANGNSDCQQSANSAAVTGTSSNPFGNGLFIPNVFTPNGDGSNDVLFVYGNTIKSLTLSIYDQWGELQFKSTNKSSGWDGTYKGTNQPVGVYVYYVEATMNDGQVVKKKGTVTLLR